MLSAWDTAIFRHLNAGFIAPAWDWLMPVLSQELTYLPLAAVLAWWLVARDRPRGWWVLAGVGLLVLLTDFTTSQILRPLLERPRPYAALAGVHFYRDGVWAWSDAALVAGLKDVFGLPSAHAANGFGLAVYLGRFYRRLGWSLAGLATAVGLSRVYLGLHYPGDVLVGAAWGLSAGWLTGWAVARARARYGPRWERRKPL